MTQPTFDSEADDWGVPATDQLPLVLLWLVAVDFCAVRPEGALDLRRQISHLVGRAGTAVEMSSEGLGVVEDSAAIGEPVSRIANPTD